MPKLLNTILSAIKKPGESGTADRDSPPPAAPDAGPTEPSERGVLARLRETDDVELQLRIVHAVDDEALLKKIARSEFNKRVVRAAEKKLRETGHAAEAARMGELADLTSRLQAFLESPQWSRADEWMETAAKVAVEETEAHPVATRFRSLRDRLRREIAEYRGAEEEMDAIVAKLGERSPIDRAELTRLKERWEDLAVKCSVAPDSPRRGSFARALEERLAPPAPRPRAPGPVPADAERAKPSAEEREAQRRRDEQRAAQLRERAEKKDADRRARIEAIEALLRDVKAVAEDLGDRNAGARLRELQAVATGLRRWKSEYAAQLAEVEALLEALTKRHGEAVEEARWDAWARTDRAVRIQAELEASITTVEGAIDTDPEGALRASAALGRRLLEYTDEMKGLGSLDRRKDHRIWVRFKALTGRGRQLSGRLREIVLGKLKEELARHAPSPPDFTGPFELKPTAFDDEVVARMRELQAIWRGLDPKPRELSRDLFEMYFRQLNLHAGRIQRQEQNALQRRREQLGELRAASEGNAPLLARLRLAQGVAEKWKRSPGGQTIAYDLRTEYDSQIARLQAALNEELGKLTVRAVALETQAGSAAAPQTLDAAGLAKAGKALSGVESDFAGIEKYFGQLIAAAPGGAEAFVAARTGFTEVSTRLRAALKEARAAIDTEVTRRTADRDRVLHEAELLALSTDAATARPRFEALAAEWKNVGTLGNAAQDTVMGQLFENVRRFHLARTENPAAPSVEAAEKIFRARRGILISLEALTRILGAPSDPLPFSDAERAASASKLVEAGFRYRPVLSLDPQAGALKETRKLMGEWCRLALPDEPGMPGYWVFYLARVHGLLGSGSSPTGAVQRR